MLYRQYCSDYAGALSSQALVQMMGSLKQQVAEMRSHLQAQQDKLLEHEYVRKVNTCELQLAKERERHKMRVDELSVTLKAQQELLEYVKRQVEERDERMVCLSPSCTHSSLI